MTAPMNISKSVTSPILIVSTSEIHLSLKLGPETLGNIGARRGGAFLSLILEGTSERVGDERIDVGRRMREHVVLAARLADDPRIDFVVLDVAADGGPHVLENFGRAGEVDAGERRKRP